MPLNINDLHISSPDFDSLARIPDRYSADGHNVAPRLTIEGVPSGTVELAVVCHDPDAPLPHGFTHWVVYGVPSNTTEIIAVANGPYRLGPNGAGESSYTGPQPPPGHGLHHYYFWVYALSTAVDGSPTREEFLDRYADSIIEQNRVVGLYSNPS